MIQFCNHCHRSSGQVEFFTVNWCWDCRNDWVEKKTGQKVMHPIEKMVIKRLNDDTLAAHELIAETHDAVANGRDSENGKSPAAAFVGK